MKRVTLIGEDHLCRDCVNDEIAYSRDFSQIAVEVIGYTKRNLAACQEYNENGSSVSQFISKLSEYGLSERRKALRSHKPLFISVRERNQKILPFRPWDSNDHYVYFPRYMKQYLTQDDNLMAVVGSLCLVHLLRHSDKTRLQADAKADMKFHILHLFFGHDPSVDIMKYIKLFEAYESFKKSV
jgi:hypothetical protein